jgi:hypothetical protein
MDGIVEAVLRLEDAKRTALIDFDSPSYEKCVRAQVSLLGNLTPEIISRTDRKDLLSLHKLIRLNTSLYQNLISASPWITALRSAYTSGGQLAAAASAGSFSAEA